MRHAHKQVLASIARECWAHNYEIQKYACICHMVQVLRIISAIKSSYAEEPVFDGNPAAINVRNGGAVWSFLRLAFFWINIPTLYHRNWALYWGMKVRLWYGYYINHYATDDHDGSLAGSGVQIALHLEPAVEFLTPHWSQSIQHHCGRKRCLRLCQWQSRETLATSAAKINNVSHRFASAISFFMSSLSIAL